MARTKGSKNKIPATARENVICVFTRLGGTAAMADWARENLTDFYRLYGKLVPQEIAAQVEAKGGIDVRISFVDP